MCPTTYEIQMETSTPSSKRLFNISEVACPDSCNQPEQERGCHFRIGPDRFTCTKCQLRIWRHFMGYELTPTDLREMLHGEKITSSEKVLTWKKDGNETTIRGRLLLNEEYKVRIAPKLKSKQTTDETCPKCKSGKLQLITAIDDSNWYGCNGYPQCRFTKTFIPHTFQTAPLKKNSGAAKAGKKGTGAGARNCDSGGGQSQSTTLRTKDTSLREKPSSGAEKPNTPANKHSDSVALAGAAINERPSISAQTTIMPAAMTPDVSDGKITQATQPDCYQRIPKFILRMLKLDREPSVKSSDGPSLS